MRSKNGLCLTTPNRYLKVLAGSLESWKLNTNCRLTSRAVKNLTLKKIRGTFFQGKRRHIYFNLGQVAAIIESLKFRSYNYVENCGKTLKWNEPALKEAVEIARPEIEIIVDYIN